MTYNPVTESYNGWPVIANNITAHSKYLKELKWTTGPGVRTGDVWFILNDFCQWFNDHIEPIRYDWSWDYGYRKYTNGDGWSCHASGTAVDLNAPKHPYHTNASSSFSTSQINAINTILATRYHGAIKWLHATDPMHFEIAVSPSQLSKIVHGIVGAAQPKPQPARPMLFRGMPVKLAAKHKPLVLSLQRQLCSKYPWANIRIRNAGGPNGIFGPATESVIIEFQARKGLKRDGIIGNNTWEALSKEGIR